MSYGTLYPRLRLLVERGLIIEVDAPELGRRARITYAVTPAGQERFQQLLAAAGPTAWEDEAFDVHFAFFGRTNRAVRLRILEGRRARLEERLAMFRDNGPGQGPDVDGYAAELHRHGLESAERDVRWVTRLIETERSAGHRGAAQHEEQVWDQLELPSRVPAPAPARWCRESSPTAMRTPAPGCRARCTGGSRPTPSVPAMPEAP